MALHRREWPMRDFDTFLVLDLATDRATCGHPKSLAATLVPLFSSTHILRSISCDTSRHLNLFSREKKLLTIGFIQTPLLTSSDQDGTILYFCYDRTATFSTYPD